MSDDLKRLLDEDPDGAASALIRSALEKGPPPPSGAKERVAKQLGIGGATVIPWRRRISTWSGAATLLVAAAAGALLLASPPQTPPSAPAAEMAPTAVTPFPRATTTAPLATMAPPAATAPVRPLNSADAGAKVLPKTTNKKTLPP